MRIESVALHHVQIPLKRAFAHAASSRTTSEAILVQVRDDADTILFDAVLPSDD